MKVEIDTENIEALEEICKQSTGTRKADVGKKYIQLRQEFYSYGNKIVRGTAQFEFRPEFIPVNIEYSFRTSQFSAKIPQAVIERLLAALKHDGSSDQILYFEMME